MFHVKRSATGTITSDPGVPVRSFAELGDTFQATPPKA
jgi:hypothetical protein